MVPISSRCGTIVVLALLIAACTSQVPDVAATCRKYAYENLERCMAGALSSAAFVQKLCGEEFEEQIQACAP